MAFEFGDSGEGVWVVVGEGDAAEVEPGSVLAFCPADEVPGERVAEGDVEVGASGGSGGMVMGIVAMEAGAGEGEEGRRGVGIGSKEADDAAEFGGVLGEVNEASPVACGAMACGSAHGFGIELLHAMCKREVVDGLDGQGVFGDGSDLASGASAERGEDVGLVRGEIDGDGIGIVAW